jgi:hypothetical protein
VAIIKSGIVRAAGLFLGCRAHIQLNEKPPSTDRPMKSNLHPARGTKPGLAG